MSLVKRRIIGSSFPYSAGNVYNELAPVADWFTVFERSLNVGAIDGSGWTGATDRQVILPYSGGGFDRINNGTQLRITLQAPAVGTLSWDKLYIGKGATSGDIYDFDGTQVQVLFSGSTSGSVSSGGLITSDAITYSHDGSRSLVVSMHHTSSELRLKTSVTGFRRFYTYPVTDTASVTDDTMNNDDGSNLSSITKIEAFGYGSVETYAVKQFFDRIPTPTSGRATLYRNLINGLVQDGWWATLDGLYIIAAADSTTYVTNLKQTSFGLVESFPSSPGTFVPDQGYTGSAFSNLSTQFNPNVNTGFNFATSGVVILGCYVTTNDPTGTGRNAISIQGTITDTSIMPLFSGLLYAAVLANDTGTANTNVQGNYMVSRSNSSSYTRYKNGLTMGSDGGAASGSFAATAPILVGSGDFQVAAAWFGGRRFGTQAQNIMARVHAYMSALGISVPYTLYSLGGTGTSSGFAGYTLRQCVPASAYSGAVPATGTRLRVSLRGGATTGATWDTAYIGHAAASGDSIDFDGTQVQLRFGGSAGGSVGATATVVSDIVNYAFNKTKNLVISVHFTAAASDTWIILFTTGFNGGVKSGVNEAATTDVTGYATNTDTCSLFSMVEVF